MPKLGRPFVYQEGEKRPVTISLRVPADVYDRLKRYASEHRQSITELLLDGLQWRLEQGADPREHSLNDIQYYDNNTVIQQLQEMVDAAVQHALAHERARLRPAAAPHDHAAPPPPPGGGMKQCRKGHAPYPQAKAECPTCVRERKRAHRENTATKKRGELPALS
jgi:hypothetical protein